MINGKNLAKVNVGFLYGFVKYTSNKKRKFFILQNLCAEEQHFQATLVFVKCEKTPDSS